MRGRAVWGAIGLALALALPVQGAEGTVPVEGRLVASGSVTLLGQNDLQATAAALVLEEGPGGAMEQARFAHPGAHARLVNVPDVFLVTPGAIVHDEWTHGEPRLLWEGDLDGFAFDGSTEPATHLRLLADGRPFDVGLGQATGFVAGPGAPLPPLDDDDAFGARLEVDGHGVRPAGGGGSLTAIESPGVAWSSPFVLLVQGGGVLLPDGTLRATGRWENRTESTVDPATGTGRRVMDNVVLVVTGSAGSVSWPQAPAGWALAVDQLDGSLDGDIAWTGVAGQVSADGKPLPTDPKLLHMRGQLRLDATFEESSTGWGVSGQAHFVAVDAGANRVALVAVTAAGVGLAALLLALLTEPGRHGLAFLVGRAGRLVHAEPLRSAPRRRVLAAIHERQPVRVAELQEATGMSRATVDYHLRVLLAYDVVQERRGTADRNRTFMLNSGSMMFPAEVGANPAHAEEDRRSALAADILAVANSHPLRRRLYELARDHGPLDFEGLKSRGGAELAGLAQSTATHHLQALVAAGALSATAQGRRRVYAAAVRDDELRVEQYRRLLGQLHALDLVRRLAAGEGLLPARARAEARTLRRLDDLGLVRREPGGGYGLSPMLAALAGRL